MPLLDEDYDDVRRAVLPGLTSAQLPDATIGKRPYAGLAEWQLQYFDPQANLRMDPAQVDIVRTARVLLVAANIVERLPVKRRERNGPYEYVATAPDPESSAGDLRLQAYLMLSSLPGVPSLQWISSINAPGGRGNVSEPFNPLLTEWPGIGWPYWP